MNKKRVETMMIEAMSLLNDERRYREMFATTDGKRKIHSRFNGYAASFGPSVIQAGLLQTLAFFCRADREAEDDAEGKDRKVVVKLMEDVLAQAGYLHPVPDGGTLFDTVREQIRERPGDRTRLKSLVLEASAACKLVMRTFPVEKER
jgi:CRISPR/Cas system CMR-associated protein Cmr5 small subunit